MNRESLLRVVDAMPDRCLLSNGSAAYSLRAEGLSWSQVGINLWNEQLGDENPQRRMKLLSDRARKRAKHFSEVYGLPWPIPKS